MDLLGKYRKQLDKIDNKIIKLLHLRHTASKEIGKIKVQRNIPTYDKEREEKLLKEIEEEADKYDLDKHFINAIFKVILENSKEIQKTNQ